MQCDTCKYFAVPLSEEEQKVAHCPGANPRGDPGRKVCVLQNKTGFNQGKLKPGNCDYYFPIFYSFR